MILDCGPLMDPLVVNRVTMATSVLLAQQLPHPVMHSVPPGHGVMALTCSYAQQVPMATLQELSANHMVASHVQLVIHVQWRV